MSATFLDQTSAFADSVRQQEKIKKPAKASKASKSGILKRSSDPFERRGREILGCVRTLEDFVRQNCVENAAYADVVGQRMGVAAMTDQDRDKVDAGANQVCTYIRRCLEHWNAALFF